MNRYYRNLCMTLLLAALTLPLSVASTHEQGQRTFAGEITDGICGMNGSHTQMMNGMSSMGPDKESCTRQCIRMGVSYMLYDPVAKAAYRLDQPAKAEPFAGHKVRIAGTLDEHTIKIAAIEALN
jgi:hypothetical protein